jgi:hypothetical protein
MTLVGLSQHGRVFLTGLFETSNPSAKVILNGRKRENRKARVFSCDSIVVLIT